MKKIGYRSFGKHLPALQYPYGYLFLSRLVDDRFVITSGGYFKRYFQECGVFTRAKKAGDPLTYDNAIICHPIPNILYL